MNARGWQVTELIVADCECDRRQAPGRLPERFPLEDQEHLPPDAFRPVAQGAASFELWTSVAAPVSVMRRALGLPEMRPTG